MEKRDLGVDIDGVLANHHELIRKHIFDVTGVDCPYEKQNQWHYEREDITREQEQEAFRRFYDTVEQCDVIPGARQAVAALGAYYNIYVITSRPVNMAGGKMRKKTENWIAEHGLQVRDIIFTEDKSLYTEDVDWLIEDTSHIAQKFYDAGGNVLLFKHPWNLELSSGNCCKFGGIGGGHLVTVCNWMHIVHFLITDLYNHHYETPYGTVFPFTDTVATF